MQLGLFKIWHVYNRRGWQCVVVVQGAGDGQAPPKRSGAMSAADQPDPSSALLHSLRSWRDASRASAAVNAPGAPPSRARQRTNPPSTPSSSRDAAVAPGAASREGGQDGAAAGEGLTLDGFRIMLGPDLRVAWFPFLQISLSSPQLVLNGPAVPELLHVRPSACCIYIQIYVF